MKDDKPIYVMDSETDPFKIGRIPKPFLFGVYGEGQYIEYPASRVDDMMEFLIAQPCIVYAHNGGRFDYHFIPKKYFAEDQELMIINGRLAKFKIMHAEFRDSFNILPTPLSAFKKEKVDYSIFEAKERNKPKNKKIISDYLRSDCINLYDYITKFIGTYGMHLTQAGASMKQWQKISKREAPRSTREFYETFKPYYYGGRVQCFRQGDIKDGFEMRDIRSAYPFAMLHSHPFSLMYERNEGGIEAEAFYKVRCVAAGCFPYREDKLRFPNDGVRRVYTVTGHELIAARETESISQVDIIESFHFLFHINFSDFINHFYTLRLAAKADEKRGRELNDSELETDAGARSLFAKLLMNSCYGKFGANPDEYKRYRLVDPVSLPEYDGSPLRDYWSGCGTWGDFGVVERGLPEDQQRYYNVATAASITGFVRAYLWRALAASREPLYCDTDAIAAKDLSHLPLGDPLGQWDLVGNFDRALIAGKKMYAFHYDKPKMLVNRHGDLEKTYWKVATKGARLSWQEIQKLCRGREVVYMPEVPTFSKHHDPRFINRTLRMTE